MKRRKVGGITRVENTADGGIRVEAEWMGELDFNNVASAADGKTNARQKKWTRGQLNRYRQGMFFEWFGAWLKV